MKVTVSGFKYSDDDGNGQRASTLIQGTPPRVVLILDSSGSTTATFQSDTGATIPDFNNDGRSDTVIDGAVADRHGVRHKTVTGLSPGFPTNFLRCRF